MLKSWVLIMSAIDHALRSLSAYRLRSALTALGVTIGVATVISIFAIIEGLNVSFKDQMSQMGTGTLYVTRTPWIVIGDWWLYDGRPRITRQDAQFLAEELALAEAVVPFVHHRTSVEIGHTTLEDVRVIGSTERWPAMSGMEPRFGRFLTRGEIESGAPVVVVGADVAESFEREGIRLFDAIRVAGRSVQVIGTLPERGRIFGQSQDDFILLPIELVERWFGKMRSVNIGVVVDPDRLGRGIDEARGAMRTRRALRVWEDDNFSINQQQMFVDLYEELTRALFSTAIGLGVMTLLVGGIGIMNIMLVAVAERTKEIGTRKALGARPRAILLQFIVEALFVSGAGGVLGTGMGVLIARTISRFTPLSTFVAPGTAISGVLFGAAVGALFGFLPAYRASRLSPVDALSVSG